MATTIEQFEKLNEAINELIIVIATEFKIFWFLDKLTRRK